MDYDKIKKFVDSQRSRDAHPIKAFSRSMINTTTLAAEIEDTEFTDKSRSLVLHLIVPHLVTIMECYFRDSLDAIFRLCKYESYVINLNKLIKKKYSVQDIIELEAEGLHFLQIIPRELSFQSLEQIISVYDNFVDTDFSSEIQKHQYRMKDYPDYIMEVTDDTLKGLSEMFFLRHEIIHNPNVKELNETTPDIGCYIDIVWGFIFCANQVIEKFIGDNLKKHKEVSN